MPTDFAPRTATVSRTTNETDISISVNLDPEQVEYENDTGIGFLDHMLDLFARHGGFSLEVHGDGDLYVDDHHTTEDIAITLGQALRQALGDKAHIARYGHAYVPMDETLARSVVDLSGRFYCRVDADFDRSTVGDLSTEMIPHFWYSLAEHLQCNWHVTVLYGSNAHHKIEAMFKSGARALRAAVRRDAGQDKVLSTKGTI